jgi:hypothetical protein
MCNWNGGTTRDARRVRWGAGLPLVGTVRNVPSLCVEDPPLIPHPRFFAERVHLLLKTKAERCRNVQSVQNSLKIRKMSWVEVKRFRSCGKKAWRKRTLPAVKPGCCAVRSSCDILLDTTITIKNGKGGYCRLVLPARAAETTRASADDP